MMRGFAKGFAVYAVVIVAMTGLAGAVSRSGSMTGMFGIYSRYDVIVFAMTAIQAGLIGYRIDQPHMKRTLAVGGIVGLVMTVMMPIMAAAADADVTIRDMLLLGSAETYLRSGLFVIAVMIFVALAGNVLRKIVDGADDASFDTGGERSV